MLTYGALVWAQQAQKLEKVQIALRKVQRLAMITMGHFRRSTPTAGLEVILDLTPLNLHIKQEALMALARNPCTPDWDGIGNGSARGHIAWIQSEWDLAGIPRWPIDKTTPVRVEPHKFTLIRDSFALGNDESDGAICYTDGSKQNGNTGCGFSLVHKKGEELTILAEESSYLGTDASVFQAEVTAIHDGAIESALQVSAGLLTESIAFKSDSRAALLAISNPLTSSKLVRATQAVLKLPRN